MPAQPQPAAVPEQQEIEEATNEGGAGKQVGFELKQRPKTTKKKFKLRRHRQSEETRTGGWDDRFSVTESRGNVQVHPFYRQYFGKQPKENPTTFRVRYASSTNELPGITAVGTKSHSKVKEFNETKEKPHQNAQKVMKETRGPVKETGPAEKRKG